MGLTGLTVNDKAKPPLNELERLLTREDGYMQEATRTQASKRLQTVRASLQEHVATVSQTGNLALIIAVEKVIVDGDLKRHANSPAMVKSLGTALSELGVVEKHLELVADPVRYRAVNQAYSLPRNRHHGLPYDEARQAMASHHTRLGNLDKSRLSADEKALIDARKAGMKTAIHLYTKLQAHMIGV